MKRLIYRFNAGLGFLVLLFLLGNSNLLLAQNTGNSTDVSQKAEDVNPLAVGMHIPNEIFLPNYHGEIIDVNMLIAEKPTILVFYRGGWCPYCNKQLAGLATVSPDLTAMGYQLVAISTDQPEGLKKSIDTNKLDYMLLSDADASAALAFGIAFKAPKSYANLLMQSTGGKNTEAILPVPSVFIVDQQGVIKYEYVNPNFKERLDAKILKAEAETILNDLK